MTTAWELSRPDHGGKYEVTVYQEGWRLGGKGASGRGASGRIEEHGLHIWLGFYDNSFRMMRQCHAELAARGMGDIYGDWRDAWTPKNDIALCSQSPEGGFTHWRAHLPPRPGLPGDPLPRDAGFSLTHYLASAFDLFRALLLDTSVNGHGVATASESTGDPDQLARRLASMVKFGSFATTAGLAQMLGLLASLSRSATPDNAEAMLGGVEKVCSSLRQWLEDRWLADSENRYLWEIADLTLATIVGMTRHRVWFDPRGLDAIEDYECREFLHMHGASLRSLQSPFIRGLYDLSMGYENGDMTRPSLSAGQGLRGTMRTFFSYRGAFMWKMRAGMGDVVFAPLYTAMKERGVRFEFFHRLTNMGMASDGDHVDSLTFDIQAKTKRGREYRPLVPVAGKPCWPSAPDFGQLAGGATMASEGWNFESHWDRRRVGTRTLALGQDFDLVVLGVGIGAVPYVASDFVERDPRWKAMCDNVKTVASQAFQVWMDEDLGELGWPGPAYITGAFAKPFDTWCDMAHVVPEEGWKQLPKTSVYFCAVLPDPADPPDENDRGYPARRAAEVRANAEEFLQGPVREVWPRAYDAKGDFRWEILKTETEGQTTLKGKARFESQYWRANVNPSDRYVIHTPGSHRYRISPLDMTYDNLTICGDWTDSGFSSGCVEGAVMSGLLAAHALCGSPKLEDITAYDHP
ncbi:FAD-dependent oxidoreductase [Erythrobacter mangrovi]|uniref:FAD-dependent oxidoreductase n=2 Tax=Erythrobacter mangrovi TaxID=2739433 RepID=A0A7D3XC35_9SPHN|nr:FAD-dependent oxidoreductase [Erythrobacter mangrovi]